MPSLHLKPAVTSTGLDNFSRARRLLLYMDHAQRVLLALIHVLTHPPCERIVPLAPECRKIRTCPLVLGYCQYSRCIREKQECVNARR